MNEGTIVKVAGPLVIARGVSGSKMYEVVYVGKEKLMGEIIELSGDRASIQVYEETGGIGPGDPVFTTGSPLSVELGPGLLESIFDGVERPLDVIWNETGNFIKRGVHVPALSREKKWKFVPLLKKGDKVEEGDIIGKVQETVLVEHRIMVPPGINGTIEDIKAGEFTVEEVVARIKGADGKVYDLKMLQKWPVRKMRPFKKKLPPDIPLITGQRVIDAFFPVAKGGTACVPGPFGSGKTVIQHQLAKWSDTDIVIYIGCGERGNEMTDVLIEFPELEDPKTGHPLMKRTVLIANTSNMPVAAREASVYTGITIGEYFRDMGYSVALMADSTSRWAEAMREISGRLEEMPGEEGYPAYLATRVAQFYERSGRVKTVGHDDREGSLTVIGAVSPPGGDLQDPVVQATLRVVKVFWSLEAKLAYARHFPAINWLTSYSLYRDTIKAYMEKSVESDVVELQDEAMRILEKEAELEEIVRLVGAESLSADDQLLLDIARSIREDFLHQNAFHEIDTYASLKKQYIMLKNIIAWYKKASYMLSKGKDIKDIKTSAIWEKLSRMKYQAEDKIDGLLKILEDIENES